MSTISGLGGANRSWDIAQQPASRRADHEARMFAKVDSDGSGGVDAAELAAMLENGPQEGQSVDSAELLKQMDADGDGSLNSDELSQGMHDLMPPPASTMAFAQSRGAANDERGPGGPPPAASGGSGGTGATSADYDPLDVNQDGTVSQLERLAGQLKELAQTASSDDSSQGSVNTEIAALAQKLYDQLSRNWLPASTPDSQLDVSA